MSTCSRRIISRGHAGRKTYILTSLSMAVKWSGTDEWPFVGVYLRRIVHSARWAEETKPGGSQRDLYYLRVVLPEDERLVIQHELVPDYTREAWGHQRTTLIRILSALLPRFERACCICLNGDRVGVSARWMGLCAIHCCFRIPSWFVRRNIIHVCVYFLSIIKRLSLRSIHRNSRPTRLHVVQLMKSGTSPLPRGSDTAEKMIGIRQIYQTRAHISSADATLFRVAPEGI